MAAINDENDRQVVPRWRSFVSAISFGELAAVQSRPPEVFDKKVLEPVIEDWWREPALGVACDLMSAAFSAGQPQFARGRSIRHITGRQG